MTPAIAIENVSKRYRLGGRSAAEYRTLRETISGAMSAPWRRLSRFFRPPGNDGAAEGADTLWALREVSLEVAPGEVIGIIGRNGAGKSTLLKVLARITEPTSGRIALRGRIGSLLEVGTGFHQELTGRENIYLNGAILGMGRRQIAQRFDEIVAFAEIDSFLDMPVKRYSSGMFVKLAFAVASHMEPDILIVDEVLAVGDMAFQRKCLGKMDQVSRSGRTVLFVSHNMATILNLCGKVALLERGRFAFVGDCYKGIELYTQACSSSSGGDADLSAHPRRRPGCPTILGRLRLLGADGQPTDQVICGKPLTIEVELDARCPRGAYHVAVGFDDTLGSRLFTAATYLTDSYSEPDKAYRRFTCRLNEAPLAPGRYALTINAGPRHWVWTDMIDQALWFEVTASDFYGNGRLPNPEWGRFLVRSKWEAQPA